MNLRPIAWIVTGAAIAAFGCAPRSAVLTELTEARRLASEIHVKFMKATEASNRAVMSDTDEASKSAAQQAIALRNALSAAIQSLRQQLDSLGYQSDAAVLEAFASRFNDYQRLDDEILPLAVENTNLKAQRLSFGQARNAVDAFRSAVATDQSPAAARAQIGALEILALEAPHIAEARDEAMTTMERDMSVSERQVREALMALRGSLPREKFADANQAFDRFMNVHAEILRLSRRNSNVRSLALTLGTKQKMTVECEAQLQALEQALSQHDFRATR